MNTPQPLSITEIQEAIVAELATITDWDLRYQRIIQFGRELPAIDPQYQTEKNRVQGCQSQVWMHAELTPEGTLQLYADSDALIVRGLVALLLKVYQHQLPSAILTEPLTFFDRLEMGAHLSMTRKNGLAAMVKQIQQYAFVFKMMQG
ncbi:MAG: SufE family protein [Candidatus Melainabacteria bacterium]|nr:SufE family protein [Candidatus Melainabacteria bacterium]